MTDEQAANVSLAIRATFAGERLYIPSRPDLSQRNANIRRDAKRGESYRTLGKRYNLSTTRISDIVNRDLDKNDRFAFGVLVD